MEDLKDRVSLDDRLGAAAMNGMTPAVWAQVQGGKTFIHNPDGSTRSFAEVNANANRIVRLLRAKGLKAGDSVALAVSTEEGAAAAGASRPAGKVLP